jgi:hypothetical protein
MKRAITEAEITARLDALTQQLAAARQEVRADLIAARNTAAARAEVGRIEVAIEAAHAELAALLEDHAAEKVAQIDAAGRKIAVAATAEIDAKMAALRPPQHP